MTLPSRVLIMHFVPTFLLVVLNICLCVQGALNECEDSKANDCGECILNPKCAWCADPEYANNPNVVIYRCNLPEILENAGCNPDLILNPQSTVNATKDKEHSNVGESDVGSATQVRPQQIEVKARPGDPVNIQLSFKQAEDYPVDLYYLLDLSKSMEDDLESLRALGEQLGKEMQKITRDFKLGFGSFVDKTVMPYISTVPKKIKNPCSDAEPCDPTYSFHNDLPLSSNIDAFVSSVGNVNHSSNLDSPEGVLDAMMQAIVCRAEINWREYATHLLVVSTDAGFHYAGDGKMGGIVLPHDGNCYLNENGEYTMANKMDYPSIGHLVKKITENNIQPIFAVTSTVVDTYENFANMIPKSVVGELTSDSSNIIQLIQDAYNDLKGQVNMEYIAPDGITISNEKSVCTGGVETEGLKCDNVKIGDVVDFSFDLIVDEVCFSEPAAITVSPFGYNEQVTILVTPQCECDCKDTGVKHSNCSGNGRYECGSCVCNDGFSGLDCACNLEGGDVGDYIDNCTNPENGVVCSDLGECQCGQCLCTQFPNRRVDGQFCECDNTTCLRHKGNICNGHGECKCGECVCEEMWSGDACECPLDNAACYDTRADLSEDSTDVRDPTKPCNGNGVCVCGSCVCNTTSNGDAKFRGQFCETKPVVLCDNYKDCILCEIYKMDNTSIECGDQCSSYSVTMLGEEGSSFSQYCLFQDPNDDCQYQAYYKTNGDEIYVEIEPEKICNEYINPIIIIIVIIAAIVGIGLALLFVWKLLTGIKDEREFKRFQEETKNPGFIQNENPIFKAPKSRFANPLYGNTSN